ncbi:Putative pentatricopeptide repeat-containing protein [Apostasia shenzhenica]|uniref:Pentatricopeptide repeat-containing protein n=1 Tax=Apostasia shenzhenica TaxID=1088818 RepID=A0A2I0AS67_9ASPA|nr:Putative pentatricopeptide repeat-containing protein [Apostasia shenzhenica]
MAVDLGWCVAHLRSCDALHWISQGRQLHQLLLKAGVLSSIFVSNCLLQMYTRCGSELADAHRLFDEMPQRNCFSWNSILDAYLKAGYSTASLQLFHSMPQKNGYSWNAIVTGLVRLGDLHHARMMFDEMPTKEAVALNSILHSYFRTGKSMGAFRLYSRLNSACMGLSYLCNDSFVLATVISACAEHRALHLGRQLHSRIVVSKVELDAVLVSALIDMYGKCEDLDSASEALNLSNKPDDFSLSALIMGCFNCGRFDEARKLFDGREEPSVVLWNSLINGFASNYYGEEALHLFRRMKRAGVDPDSSTLTTMLSVCADIGVLGNLRQIHSHVLKYGVLEDIVVGSALLDAYSKAGQWDDASMVFAELKIRDTILLNSMINVYSNCGKIREARQIFDMIQRKTLISWNSMIVGYNQNGYATEALNLFANMHALDVELDKVTIASVLSAATSHCSLSTGEQIFALATRIGLDSNRIICTSLIDLYCKCGCITEGCRLFNTTRKCDEAPWNSMLMGCASNGLGTEALELFEAMRSNGVSPNDVTFLAILSCCCHCGLLEEGLRLFHSMKNEFGINPSIEHYSCVVDLLVRGGRINEAIDFIDGMPFKPDASMLTSVLGGCKACGHELLGIKVAQRIMELNPSQSVPYVQISSIYAANENWNRSEGVWLMMRDKMIKKNPGFSWIDL